MLFLPHLRYGASRAALDGVAAEEALIIVVAGQSNARAFATTGSDVPVELQASDSGIQIWNSDLGQFEEYEAGANSDTWNADTAAEKWGPEAAFAHAFRDETGASDIYIVKIAVDSTTLASDAGGDDWDPDNSGELYDDMVGELNSAKAELTGSGKTPVVAAVLWMQGEHDALDSTDASNYGVNLDAFIDAVRSDWGDSNTKFILGRISASEEWTFGSAVRAFQARIARDKTDVQAIDTDSYTLDTDDRHYVAASVQTMGEDMYDAYAGDYTLLPVRFGTHSTDKSASVTLSNGNLTAAGSGANSSAFQPVRCDQVLNGLIYVEFLIDQQTANLNVGMGKGLNLASFWGNGADNIGYAASGAVFKNNTQVQTYTSYTTGDRVMMAFNSSSQKVWFGKNGSWNGDPAAGTGEATALTATTGTSYHRFGVTLRRSGDQVTLKATAAEFSHTPPTGFAAI